MFDLFGVNGSDFNKKNTKKRWNTLYLINFNELPYKNEMFKRSYDMCLLNDQSIWT